jgi:hypothetical protein
VLGRKRDILVTYEDCCHKDTADKKPMHPCILFQFRHSHSLLLVAQLSTPYILGIIIAVVFLT